MNLNNLFEAVKEEYYDMGVVKVASDFPLELARIFFDMFSEMVFTIPGKQRQEYFDGLKDRVNDKQNPWLDTINRNVIEFDDLPTFKAGPKPPGAFSKDYDNMISINFYGSRVKVGLKNKGTDIYESPKMWDADGVTVREFFTKLFGYFKETAEIDRHRMYRDKEYNPIIRNNPELYKQTDSVIGNLSKMWLKRGLKVRTGDDSSRVDTGSINVSLDYSNYNGADLSSYKYERLRHKRNK